MSRAQGAPGRGSIEVQWMGAGWYSARSQHGVTIWSQDQGVISPAAVWAETLADLWEAAHRETAQTGGQDAG